MATNEQWVGAKAVLKQGSVSCGELGSVARETKRLLKRLVPLHGDIMTGIYTEEKGGDPGDLEEKKVQALRDVAALSDVLEQLEGLGKVAGAFRAELEGLKEEG